MSKREKMIPYKVATKKLGRHFDPFTRRELVPGLIVHLDPERVKSKGGSESGRPDRVGKIGVHYFMLVAVKDKLTYWAICTTNAKPWRTSMPREGYRTQGRVPAMWGQTAKEKNRMSYVDRSRLWRMTLEQLNEAAKTTDRTVVGGRNYYIQTYLPPFKPSFQEENVVSSQRSMYCKSVAKSVYL